MLLLSAAQALFARFSVRTGIAALFINSLECKKHSFLCACRTGQKCAPVSKRTNCREALFVRGIAGRFVPKQKHQSAAFAGACFRFCRAADEAFSSVVILPFVRARIRVLPLTLIRKEIKNQTIRSFLFYVPYVTLAVMTFPAIIQATDSMWAGLAALIAGIALAWFGGSLFQVAVAACAVVFVLELFL